MAVSAINVPVSKFVLDNGLTVLVSEDHSSPVFTGFIMAKTGSVNENPGITGTSHLLEHMMFKGTKLFGTTNYQLEMPLLKKIDQLASEMRLEQAKLRTSSGKGSQEKVDQLREQIAELEKEAKQYSVSDELWRTYQRNGGMNLNASTGRDATQYYVQLPSNKFQLWAFLESDRFNNAVFREFYSERDVVTEERRMRVDNDPYGKLSEQFSAVVHTASTYGTPIVGWPDDLKILSREDMQEYFKAYYAPNNLIVAIVGDLECEQVKEVMQEYFGKIPSQPAPKPRYAKSMAFTGERRIEVVMDSNPEILIGYPGPIPDSDESYALDFLADLLSDGRSSRITRNIVNKGLASEAQAWMNTRALDTVFMFNACPQAPHSASEVENAFYNEIAEIIKEKPAETEMDKVRNNYCLDFMSALESPMTVARMLAYSEAFSGGYENFDDRQRLLSVTSEMLQQVCKKYLVRNNRTVAVSVNEDSCSKDDHSVKNDQKETNK